MTFPGQYAAASACGGSAGHYSSQRPDSYCSFPSQNMDDFVLKFCNVLLFWPPVNLVAEVLEANVEP